MIPQQLAACAAALRARWLALPAPLRGAAWMTVAAGAFAGMNTIIRALTMQIPVLEVVFLRSLAGFAFMVPWLLGTGFRGLQTSHHRLFISRSALAFISMVLSFWAFALLPVAEATALSFTAPLFATVSAIVVLGERVRLRRWTATFIGFFGAMIVVRPGIETISLGHVVVLASSAIGGFNGVVVKQLTRTEPTNTIVTYTTLWILPMALVPALFVWVWPPHDAWLLIALLGLLGTIGHQCFTRAFAIAEASMMAPFDFAKLPLAAFLAWTAFGEIPDRWMWVGAAVIAGSTAYIARREAQLARERDAALAREAASRAVPPPGG